MTVGRKAGLAACLILAGLLGGLVWVTTYRPWRVPALIKVAGSSDQKATVALGVHVAPGATNVVRSAMAVDGLYPGYIVEGDMPSDDWSAYVSRYLPQDALTPETPDAEHRVPSVCRDDCRLGTTVTRWSAADRIPYFGDPNTLAGRTVLVTPDCSSGIAHVMWLMAKPDSGQRTR